MQSLTRNRSGWPRRPSEVLDEYLRQHDGVLTLAQARRAGV